MIELQAVRSGYGKREILHGITLKAEPGTVLTLIGHNGCGKSTVLQTMLGMLPLTGGDVLLNGRSIRGAAPSEIAKTAAYLPQIHQGGDITAGRLVLHGRFPHLRYPRRYRAEDYTIAQAALERMGIADLAQVSLNALSGGQRQKVYIAMALAQDAPIIVMDEPTTFLDIGQQFRFARIVRELSQQEGKTIVLVLHDLLLALALSDQIAALENGTLMQCGAPETFLETDVFQRLYGVTVRSVDTPHGRRYYYDQIEGDTL